MNQFLEKRNLPPFSQCEVNHLNSPITIKEKEFIIFKFSKKESSGPDGFTENSTKVYKEKLMPILNNSFRK